MLFASLSSFESSFYIKWVIADQPKTTTDRFECAISLFKLSSFCCCYCLLLAGRTQIFFWQNYFFFLWYHCEKLQWIRYMNRTIPHIYKGGVKEERSELPLKLNRMLFDAWYIVKKKTKNSNCCYEKIENAAARSVLHVQNKQYIEFAMSLANLCFISFYNVKIEAVKQEFHPKCI